MSLSSIWSEFKAWWEGTSIGAELDAAAKATAAEIESIAPAALEGIVESTSAALLPGIAAGGTTASIISAGITAAENAFKAAGATVASTTVSTFTSALHNSISTQQAAGGVTPAPAS